MNKSVNTFVDLIINMIGPSGENGTPKGCCTGPIIFRPFCHGFLQKLYCWWSRWCYVTNSRVAIRACQDFVPGSSDSVADHYRYRTVPACRLLAEEVLTVALKVHSLEKGLTRLAAHSKRSFGRMASVDCSRAMGPTFFE